MAESTRGTPVSRRLFVKQGAVAGAGLVLAVHLPLDQLRGALVGAGTGGGGVADFTPNAWIRIGTDGIVTIVVDEAEMGQGAMTTVPQIVAEELEADWSLVRAGPVPSDPSSWPRSISTGGSTTVRLGWETLRKAGAAAREMLREAAALEWGVETGECRAVEGTVRGPGGRSLTYGELADRAATLDVPDDPPLKDEADFRIIGQPLTRLDLAEKGRGETVYGTDVRLDGMKYAVLARPPSFGATVASFDDGATRGREGVEDVLETPHGVAVVASSTWAALQGRDALQIRWDRSAAESVGTPGMSRRARELASSEGEVLEERGDVQGALGRLDRAIEVDYELPFLDHAPMEPLNATALVRRDGRVEVWVPTQVATASQQAAARTAGVPVDQVVMHVPGIGGGFGRRLNTDDVEQAVALAMEMPDVPVQLFWTREDTTRHGFYRPYTYHRMRGGLDAGGAPVAWSHRLVGVGSTGVIAGGATAVPYQIPNFRVDLHRGSWNVPTGALRSVGYTQNGFTVEAFVDELAAAAGRDPYEYRRELLADERLRNVLDVAAERAGWGTPLGENRGRGIAAVFSFGSYVSEVAEVTVENDRVRVDRMVCAIDLGRAVNPDGVRAQIEGGVAFGLTHALKGSITLESGGVREGNFHDYPLLGIREMPEVEVHIVESGEHPGGVGEPGVPPVAPAVANAIFQATGRRVRRMPIRMGELSSVSDQGA
ncbi:MAG: xanthine dehydrogenase family protein molybdopterin-binding subunit [Gemmatimonadota bacterium]|jgi:isoquinoline 1-oxidoreductase beta subunit